MSQFALLVFLICRQHLSLIAEYKIKTEKELGEMCHSILEVLDKHLIPNATSGEAKIFLYKMKGDYYRFCFWLQIVK